jgi:hypothetical protein
MTFTDYLLDSLLVLVVIRQIRESRMDLRATLLPLGIMAFVVNSYLHAIPTSGNDLYMIIGFALLGVAFGAVSAAFTRVRTDGGKYALIKAGWISAGLWVFSMSGRLAFSVWASNGGGKSLVHFSIAHDLSADAWTAALVLMAVGEVVTRTGLLCYRSYRALHAGPRVPQQEMITA